MVAPGRQRRLDDVRSSVGEGLPGGQFLGDEAKLQVEEANIDTPAAGQHSKPAQLQLVQEDEAIEADQPHGDYGQGRVARADVGEGYQRLLTRSATRRTTGRRPKNSKCATRRWRRI